MRRLLYLFPISRREADKAADVIGSMGWGELINSALLISLILVILPIAVLMLDASESLV